MAEAQTPVQISVLAQYVKDFSFESPNAPQIFSPSATQPKLNIGVNVQTKPVADNNFEVALMMKVEAKLEDKVAFIVELAYAGLFVVPTMPEENLKAFLLVEAPRLLFPFARSIIASTVREGGFPQLLVNPIDFMALYEANMQQMQKPAEGTA